MNKKLIFLFIFIAVLPVAYYLLSPFWIDTKVNEDLPIVTDSVDKRELPSDSTLKNKIAEDKTSPVVSPAVPVTIKQGQFTGFDKIHNGSGTASVLKVGDKSFVRFESDFQVNNGPDLYVGLGENGIYTKGSELGRLKGNIGSQNYELPENINPEEIKEVWVWCKAFSVPFVKAELK